MRIGFGTTMLCRGMRAGRLDGIGVYSRSLLNAYAAKGITPAEYYFSGVGRGLDAESCGGQRISFAPFAINALFCALTNLPSLGSGAIEKEVDIFHASDHHIPKLKATPVVATIMDAISLAHPEWASPSLRKLKNLLFSKTVAWADHVITISSFAVPDLVRYFRIPEERISVVPLGVDEDYFRTLDEETRSRVLDKYGLRPGFFIFIGTLQPRKNVERIIAAHRMLPLDIQRERPLVIVGQNGWGTAGLLPMLADLEAGGTGRWLNYVPHHDAMALMQSACALVFPSLYEGFGLPVLEAFASRLPVVTSNTTSLPEVAGDAALLVNPEDIGEICSAMTMLATTPTLRRELMEKGLLRAKELTWSRCADKTLEIYRSVLDGW